jgi:hypothetical protein
MGAAVAEAVVLAAPVVLVAVGLVAPQPPGYIPLRCGDYNSACWNDYIRRTKEENDRQAAILSESKNAAELDKLNKEAKLDAESRVGYPNGMPPNEPNGREPKPSGTGSRGVAKPTVTDPKLRNIVQDLYKGANTKKPIGTGSTADAIRHERATGQNVGGKFHTQKGREYAQGLQNWLDRRPGASESDRAAARAMLEDLRNAIDGK